MEQVGEVLLALIGVYILYFVFRALFGDDDQDFNDRH